MELARERAKAARVEAERASERAENASLRQQMGPISLPTRSAQTLHTHLRRVRRLLHIMQVANGSRDVRHDDKRAGQASLRAVQANTKAIGTTQAQKERTKQWNNSTNQTWSSAWSNLESK